MAWTRFFFRSRWDDERARELAAHLQIDIDDHIARGMTPDAARQAAQRKIGNVTLVREEIYRMNTIGFLDSAWRDLRYGRRNEIGIRMVMREAGVLLAAGIVAGLALSVAAGRAATTLLFGLQPGDPVTLALAAAGLGLVAMLASYLPARRASRLEPTEALRED